MTIVKKKAKKKNYSVIDNEGLQNRSVSWQATGLWAWFMSKPDDWEVNLEHLCSSKTNGKDSTLSVLSELEEAGYLIYQRWRNPSGQFESAYTVFESPEQLNEWKSEADSSELASITKVSKTKGRKRATKAKPQGQNHGGKTAVVNPQWESRNGSTTVDNPRQLNIDRQSTDLQTPLTPQGELDVCLPSQSSPVEPEEEEVSNTPLASLDEKLEFIPRTEDTPEIKDSASACDNNESQYYESSTAKQEVMFRRPKLDLWLDSPGLNGWKPEFIEHYRQYLSSTPRYLQTLCKQATEGDARNSLIDLTRTEEGRHKIQNHWDNYQASLTLTVPAQHIAAPDTVHQPRKPIKLAGKR